MKLNPDCIRDILLTVEEYILTPSDRVIISPKVDYSDTSLEKYNFDELYYHTNQCYLSGFFTHIDMSTSRKLVIKDLSPQGHEFLNKIKNDTNWNSVKTRAGKVGSFALDTLQQISTQVIADLINRRV